MPERTQTQTHNTLVHNVSVKSLHTDRYATSSKSSGMPIIGYKNCLVNSLTLSNKNYHFNSYSIVKGEIIILFYCFNFNCV